MFYSVFSPFSGPILYCHSLWIQLTFSCRYFQQQHPALIYALYWLTGSISREYPLCGGLLLLALTLFIPKQIKNQLVLGSVYFLSLFLSSPNIPHEGPTSGIFVVKSKNHQQYLGEVKHLYFPCGKQIQHMPCSILSKEALKPHVLYSLEGETRYHTSHLIFKSNACQEIPLTKGSILQNQLQKYIQNRLLTILPGESGHFASSLLLGMPLPKRLKTMFQLKGLSHLFAVSGWHFGLFTSLSLYMFSFCSPKPKYLLTLTLLSLLIPIFPYSPSVWRAWVSAALICLSPFSLGICSNLNRIGLSYILCSFFFPQFSPAFVLTFLSTLGIMLFFPPLFQFFYSPYPHIFPSYCLPLLKYLWGSFSLSLSSQLFILFPAIYFFKSMPLDGLIYNLFFPTLVLPIFFFSLASLFIPYLGTFTHSLISMLLSFPTLTTPNFFPSISLKPLASWQLTLLFISLFLTGVYLRGYQPTEEPIL